jgi:hypothetical protein
MQLAASGNSSSSKGSSEGGLVLVALLLPGRLSTLGRQRGSQPGT